METSARVGEEELRGIYLLAGLTDEELEEVARGLRVVRLAESERLFDHGQPARFFFYLRAGEIKLFRTSAEGGEKVIDIVRPRETFAEAAMFMQAGGYPVSAEAIVASELLAFEQKTMMTLLGNSTATCFRLMAIMSRRLRQQVDEIDRLTLHNATFRLVSFFLQQIPPDVLQSPEIHLTTPKHVIASRLGIQPETLSRILARLAREGYLEVQAQNIVLKDLDALRELANV
ncbi:MAG: Crp/Fnr family transcriptional regulator [Gammaproteobacteria bacterium]|nr:Crp/Fnr family transcriptional regulator [Gammaproteobacteria bacterium]